MMGQNVTLPLHYAYPRVEGSSARQKRARCTRRHTHNARNDGRTLSIFFDFAGGDLRQSPGGTSSLEPPKTRG